MVWEPNTSDFKEEGSECMSESESCSSVVQVYNSGGMCGSKKWTAEAVYESCRLKVQMSNSGNMGMSFLIYAESSKISIIVVDAEIISKRKEADGSYRFYVHYVDCNRRLDEWVTEDRLDLMTVRIPQRVKKSTSQLSFASSIDQGSEQSFSMNDGQR